MITISDIYLSDYHPNASVIIETDKGIVQQFKTFTHINVNTLLEGINSASITFSNVDDRYGFGFEKDPKIRPLQKEEEIYLANVLSKAKLDHVLNKELDTLLKESQGSLSKLRQLVRKIDDFKKIYPFREMSRIWIDFQGRDEVWYAGFTGIIVSVQDVYSVGGVPSINVSCLGATRWLDFGDIITRLDVSEALPAQDLTTQSVIDSTALTNNFAGQAPATIIREIMKDMNGIFSYQGALSRRGIFVEPKEEFFYDKTLFEQKSVRADNTIESYTGLSNKRDLQSLFKTSDKIDLNAAASVNPTIVEKFFSSKLYVDPEILKSTKVSVYEKIIKDSFGLLTVNRCSGWSICRHVADTILCDLYSDEMGNVIFQEPKYNLWPNIDSVENDTTKDTSKEEAEEYLSTERNEPVAQKALYIYSYYYDRLAYHGLNYIIDDRSLEQLTLTRSESGVVTFVSTPTGMDFIPGLNDEFIKAKATIGWTDIRDTNNSDLRALQRRYGVRRRDIRSIVFNDMSGASQTLRNALARAALNRLNVYRFTGSARFSWRPDIQIGRTVLIAEKQLLGYIISKEVSWDVEAPCSTSVGLSVVHPLSAPVDIPFDLLKPIDRDSKPKELINYLPMVNGTEELA